MITLAAVQEAWLFTRGLDSVRIVRIADTLGGMRLVVRGPRHGDRTYEVEDGLDCTFLQAELERELVADGYSLHRFGTDRRAGRDRRAQQRLTERRRSLRAIEAGHAK
jgi:hypothetical protein